MAAAVRPVIGRIPITELTPSTPNGFPSKAFDGEVVTFGATVFREGHGVIGADLVLERHGGGERTVPMRLVGAGTDRFEATVQLDGVGSWSWRVESFADDWATWVHGARLKIDAGVDTEATLLDGAVLLERLATESDSTAAAAAAERLRDASLPATERMRAVDDPRVTAALDDAPLTSLRTRSPKQHLEVERARAGVGAWYEFFPRSEGAKRTDAGTWRSGTFRTAARRLPAIARMGFDVVYLPPIHPIGTTARKGPNNTLHAGPGDPGSPWAIGSAAGGHDAIHPDLGTERDFREFVDTAKNAGLEVALDFALQCSPDHPWVAAHPEWFTVRADGSIATAENPPKRYQDIYPIQFDSDPDGIVAEVLRVLRHWVSFGVQIFRVDNPHTKPLWFWERVIRTIRAEHPELVFLAEAFTRPAMMRALAECGFEQSYTYFTWRNTKEEIESYFDELSHETSAYLRPNLFVNTPDILTEYLQFGGRAAYKIRAALAATGSPTWGVYSGYELFEDVARPGSEENIDNEKYEYKPRDYALAEAEGASLAPYLTMLNRLRTAHPSLRQLRNLHVHAADNEAVVVYSKHLDGRFTRTGRPDSVIVVANVDPHSLREATVYLDLTALGLEPGTRFDVRDVVTGNRWVWGDANYVRLDAFDEPVHLLVVEGPHR
ncbi:alpha-1,4-glucan--maltose-1-phosphate maltosyltransferase [Curtobacterium ammoniigenes]|uniref:alpha-1,4-glucan--maltose-1-phosphate maltosyltransferase n=1 Tax=Curtobacterium ammoniigenes TaxID=395387 RepID=UPI0009FA1786|nr:alpha-1,4-glucan--maltose-1-phosphate maltosyltransferase [Curtobacterium ammoniigenes]